MMGIHLNNKITYIHYCYMTTSIKRRGYIHLNTKSTNLSIVNVKFNKIAFSFGVSFHSAIQNGNQFQTALQNDIQSCVCPGGNFIKQFYKHPEKRGAVDSFYRPSGNSIISYRPICVYIQHESNVSNVFFSLAQMKHKHFVL